MSVLSFVIILQTVNKYLPILRVNNNAERSRSVSSIDNHPPVGVDKIIDFNFLLRSVSPVKFAVYPIPCYVPYTWKKITRKMLNHPGASLSK